MFQTPEDLIPDDWDEEEDDEFLEDWRTHDYVPHGEGCELFKWITGDVRPPAECMFEGVAGSGKTRLIGEWIRTVAGAFPKSKGLVLRQERKSLNDSFIPIFEEEVLGLNHPAVIDGPNQPENRQRYKHPSLGGEIVLGGIDKETKLFSTQYDWIYFCEMQETTKEKWESLHRALRRPAHLGGPGWHVLLGDCNPDARSHWANQRAIKGILPRLRGRFWDNPLWFDHETNTWTEAGLEYIGKLGSNLTGARRQRLFLGKWFTAEGLVWPQYDPGVHVLSGELERELHADGRYKGHVLHVPGWEDPVRLTWFLIGYDYGFTAPGCMQVWGFDKEGRMYRVAEVYRQEWDSEDWAKVAVELYDEFRPKRIICDHDPALIKLLNDRVGPRTGRGVPRIAVPWDKRRGGKGEEKAGIEHFRVRLRPRKDGTRGAYLLRDALRMGKDPDLARDMRPTCFEDEIDSYVYPLRQDDKPIKEEPDPKCPDHACDVARAVAFWADLKDFTPPPKKERFAPGTLGHTMGHDKILGRGAAKRRARRGRRAA